MLETFTLATFTPLVGTNFEVTIAEGKTVMLRLTSATSLSRGGGVPRGHAREPFSLVYQGPRQPVLPQRTYPFSHPKLGAFDLFIVPIQPEKDRACYEVIFT